MCGIHYIQSKNREDLSKISQMIDASEHRGMDGKNHLIGENFAIGHNLLAINGKVNQPFENEQFILSFNGEIYNYKELATKHQITDYQNDAEVLFKLLCRNGMKILEELDGMFAFVFIDKIDQKTYFARDFYGQKPLFYSTDKNLFVASSELKNLKLFSGQKPNISKDEIKHFLTFKFVNSSIFKNFKQLKPATFLCIDKNFNVEEKSYTLHLSNTPNLKESIIKSIELQSDSNHRPAVFFSGGLDSSIVLYELHKLGKNPIAYTIDNSEIDSKYKTKDLKYSKDFCQKLGIEHHLIKPEKNQFQDFIQSMDLPVGDGAFYLQWLLSKEISKNHKIAFSGNGADELFAGYRRHSAFDYYLQNNLIIKVITKIKFIFSDKSKQKFLQSINSKSKAQTFENFTKTGFDFHKNTFIQKAEFSLKDALKFDQENYLPKNCLSISDQSAMTFGLELRNPFLCNDLTAFFDNSSPRVGKKSLKEIYSLIPEFEPIINRKKEGFGIPFYAFWGKEISTEFLELLNYLKEFLTENEFSQIAKTVQKFDDNYSNEYWSLWVLLNWLKTHHG
jgi:asparagine synthase (glutamine-hydrolysing)